MSLYIVPETVAATYELLRTTPPFKGWRLPHADEVEFRVVRDGSICGSFRFITPSRPVLSVSAVQIGRLETLVRAVAHEMTHMHEDRSGQSRADVEHSAAWWKYAKLVCRHHGFEVEQF